MAVFRTFSWRGVAFAFLGLLLSVFFVRDSDGHARAEATVLRAGDSPAEGRQPSFRTIFLDVILKDCALSSASQAGMINNLNDGMAWGLFPLHFAASGLPLGQVGRSSCEGGWRSPPPAQDAHRELALMPGLTPARQHHTDFRIDQPHG